MVCVGLSGELARSGQAPAAEQPGITQRGGAEGDFIAEVIGIWILAQCLANGPRGVWQAPRRGKAFSRSNVVRIRQFYHARPKGATLSHLLSWSHIVELLKIEDPR